MLNQLHLKHFTVFQDTSFDFSPGLNVIIGDNGTGKTHVLKLGYLFLRAWIDLTSNQIYLGKKRTEADLEERLSGLFRIADLRSLVSHGYESGATLSANVSGHLPFLEMWIHWKKTSPAKHPSSEENMQWDISLHTPKDQAAYVEAVYIPEDAATNAFVFRPIFIPSKEIVSLFKGLIGLFQNYRQFPLDETYRDLAVALSTLEPSEPSPLFPSVSLRILELLGGELKLEDNDLVFIKTNGTRLESQLMAEGHRKLAMLIYLLRYMLIEDGSTLFWDEPETNLNPAAARFLAEALYMLAGQGVQVIVATHSLFLLREFEVLSRNEKLPKAATRFFALGLTNQGVSVSAGNTLEDCDPLVLLDEDLAQSDRFMETLQ